MSKKVVILKGLPASGKSTWAKKKVTSSHGAYKRVNRDDLRAMIDDGVWSKGNEAFIVGMRNHLILAALDAGKHVIVDDTNFAKSHERDIRTLVKNHNLRNDDNVAVEVKMFDTSVEDCIERDKTRTNSVGADVILKMAKQYLPGYDVPTPEINLTAAQDNGLPWCVIYDLDGTAAIMGSRSPYDASQCDTVDRPNIALQLVLGAMRVYNRDSAGDMQFIAMSGRSSQYREATELFITKHNFPCDALYMRAEDDNRKDAIVKKEMYEAHVKGKFNVLVVFDDRNQMIDFWRKDAGLPCFQVNYGDF